MPQSEHEPANSTDRSSGKKSKPWFTRNQGGAGFHPSSWQGVVLLVSGLAVVVAIVVLLRTGVI